MWISIIIKPHKHLIPVEIKEKPRVALHLHCSIKNSNVNMYNIYCAAMLYTLWHATEDS